MGKELGVPSDRTAETLQLILENAKAVGYLRDVKGQTYVDLEIEPAPTIKVVSSDSEERVAREVSSIPLKRYQFELETAVAAIAL